MVAVTKGTLSCDECQRDDMTEALRGKPPIATVDEGRDDRCRHMKLLVPACRPRQAPICAGRLPTSALPAYSAALPETPEAFVGLASYSTTSAR